MKRADIKINPDEDIEDIIWGGFSLIQKKKGFRFGIDAYLLADFVRLNPREKLIDICTGTGIVAFLLLAKRHGIDVTALDILPEMTDLVERSAAYNDLANIRVITEDLRKAPESIGSGLFSHVVANPPYFPVGAGDHSPLHSKAVARTELLCSLDELVCTASRLLNYGGKFTFVHRPTRLPDIFTSLRAYSLEPKRMRLVHPHLGKEPNLVLIEARKNAGQELRILPPLFIYEEPGKYSLELKRFFNADQSK